MHQMEEEELEAHSRERVWDGMAQGGGQSDGVHISRSKMYVYLYRAIEQRASSMQLFSSSLTPPPLFANSKNEGSIFKKLLHETGRVWKRFFSSCDRISIVLETDADMCAWFASSFYLREEKRHFNFTKMKTKPNKIMISIAKYFLKKNCP